MGHREKSYSEREEEHVELAFRQANILLFVCQACQVECCLLLKHWASDEILHRCLALGSSHCSFACCIVLRNTGTVRHVSYCFDDTLRQVHVPLDLADEVENNSLFGDTEHLGVEVFGIIWAKHVVTFAISVIIGIVDNVDQAVVAHTP